MVLSRQVRSRWWSVALLTVIAAVAFAVMIWTVGQQTASPTVAGQEVEDRVAEGNGADDHPTAIDDNDRFTGADGVWPPQPKDASDIVERSAGVITPRSQTARLAALDAAAPAQQAPSDVVASSAEVQDAIGGRNNLIAVEDVDGSTRMIWYSLSTNQTVDALVADGGVVSLDTYEPGTFQPELSDAEKQAAIDLARAHWVSRGDRRIDSLQGFSILAFQPSGAYYDTRMVYVSFHVDEDSRPELLALVDLVSEEITQSEVDR